MEFEGDSGSFTSGSSSIDDDTAVVPVNWNLFSDFKIDASFVSKPTAADPVLLPSDPMPATLVQSTSQENFWEDHDFSDIVLNYISRILMEEDVEDQNWMFWESTLALQAAEKPFYDILGEKYPPSPNQHPSALFNQSSVSQNEDSAELFSLCNANGYFGGSELLDPQRNYDASEGTFCHVQTNPADLNLRSCPHSLEFSSTSSGGYFVHGFGNSAENCPRSIPYTLSECGSTLKFGIGDEEAANCNFFVEYTNNELLLSEPNREPIISVGEACKQDQCHSFDGFKGRKHPLPEDLDIHARTNKQSAVSTISTVRSEVFDMLLLSCGEECESALREAFEDKTSMNAKQISQCRESKGGKTRRRKQKDKSELADLWTLLTLCAQAIAADNRRNASEVLKQIRQHSSPTGDGLQRLADCFADGLEARLAGFGTESHTALVTRPISAVDILKAQHVFLAVCPFLKLSHFFSNKTILQVAEKATRLHIIDFGIYYGFQWPSFIEQLSSRQGGPPKLRITGIDLPKPGFRPTERIEETGHRLAEYAKKFNVPFEFNAIAQNFETIQIEDIHIDSHEILVVNCLFRFRYLLDESVISKSPRDTVLNLIRKMNPDVFIQAVVNAAYNVPFFLTRFREALFHYSAMFDILETTVPRDVPERMLVEKEILGREIMNVIACEGLERIERAETYKQWQVRNLRAGFRQLPLNKEILKTAKEWTTSVYHKDFVVDHDGQWLLQGWKGRILNGLASWKPVN